MMMHVSVVPGDEGRRDSEPVEGQARTGEQTQQAGPWLLP